MSQPENAVVVAVPAAGGDAALTFAVEEARRSGSPLHLVHVLQLPGGEPYAMVYGTALDAAQSALDTAQRRAKQLSGGSLTATSEP